MVASSGAETVVGEVRGCVHCGAVFEVNRRAGSSHQWCAAAICQRDRRRRAQEVRRAVVSAPRSPSAKQAHAVYMAAYRANDPGYRERERVARQRLRTAARRRKRAVSEAGSTASAAVIYVVDDAEAGTQLRVVTTSGRVVTFCVEDRESPSGAASGAGSLETPVGTRLQRRDEAG
jgi:hypothetical protein